MNTTPYTVRRVTRSLLTRADVPVHKALSALTPKTASRDDHDGEQHHDHQRCNDQHHEVLRTG